MGPVLLVGETANGLEWAQHDFGDNLLTAFSGPRIDFERT